VQKSNIHRLASYSRRIGNAIVVCSEEQKRAEKPKDTCTLN
jgi:hypothetical protein